MGDAPDDGVVDSIIASIKTLDEGFRKMETAYAAQGLKERNVFIAFLKQRIYRGKLEEALYYLLKSKGASFDF